MRKIARILWFLLLLLPFGFSIVAASGGQRIMVFAPHPDDEALSCSGLIRRALDRGDQVKVVLFTCGDGYIEAKAALASQHPDQAFDRDGDGDFDMIDYGILRHNETLSAIRLMGLDPQDVIFMGYPDMGGGRIWTSSTPQKSPYTHTDKVPYDFAYNPGSSYSRSACLDDFTAIVRDFDPTIVVTPRPTDTLADHWALSLFVSQSLADLYSQLSNFKAHLGYLIHWEKHQPNWPEKSTDWERPAGHPRPVIAIPLAEVGMSIEDKRKIIDQYFSQVLFTGEYLQNFAKKTEVFWLESLGPHGTLEEVLAF